VTPVINSIVPTEEVFPAEVADASRVTDLAANWLASSEDESTVEAAESE
jgi:hypothetical protein